MSELRALLRETTERVLSAAPDWARIEEAGLAKVLVPEDEGGFGGNWEDAFVVIRACGYHAVEVPLADAILATRPAEIHAPMVLAGQMAGALAGALDLSVRYTRERHQFGKPLSGFQAIQQQLAVFAEEAADGLLEHAAQLAHRRPSPRAMMPRRISRVPPRSEYDGAFCTR